MANAAIVYFPERQETPHVVYHMDDPGFPLRFAEDVLAYIGPLTADQEHYVGIAVRPFRDGG